MAHPHFLGASHGAAVAASGAVVRPRPQPKTRGRGSVSAAPAQFSEGLSPLGVWGEAPFRSWPRRLRRSQGDRRWAGGGTEASVLEGDEEGDVSSPVAISSAYKPVPGVSRVRAERAARAGHAPRPPRAWPKLPAALFREPGPRVTEEAPKWQVAL